MAEFREYYRRHLPHWQPYGATFFITFRLKATLPHAVIEALRKEREVGQRNGQDVFDVDNSFKRWDALLDDARFGNHWLSDKNVARIIRDAIHYRDGQAYDLYAYCLMPNHVHMVVKSIMRDDSTEQPLNKTMQSLKRYTARKANVVLGRKGAFWQDESYDHVVRNNEEFLQIIYYILFNPVKVGLISAWEDWPWTYCKDELLKKM